MFPLIHSFVWKSLCVVSQFHTLAANEEGDCLGSSLSVRVCDRGNMFGSVITQEAQLS